MELVSLKVCLSIHTLQSPGGEGMYISTKQLSGSFLLAPLRFLEEVSKKVGLPYGISMVFVLSYRYVITMLFLISISRYVFTGQR